ncbi:MBL fold metallo-hydrolase [Mesorhizobium sp. M2D.F.Ca.ET.185.01.1.1]|uniref:MBL fold metallo-hydrolase n=1 Tax=unclassified Mesorhizobium TaxID=325217 RepID=UPI000FCC278A|nr:MULTISPECIES: MBL fold metallo-hydrolase [unclassified Mesorhizobium]TGP79011.1 MBL fold metallo-hydrolase [bacterium M00.F.Ca.ET.227.01.1.1]TGP89460.1 MBL fold metallo-hydrolase [bacterium M00.F.Ca.ET.221.01.1.1]TGP94828.1 MBL fold metallo-hydrolase [bacterium M00.F.Ca.ET.222.01.1.1]TGU02684.1 MBL fold metallo-hydrolase [bacterium M00.F.Ca.ET.163.01.1.1]TGU28457.1 MBL fold metallo-hydrolase [bacterium M00.F.Ca.ET.156.01.1.1]TGU45817.1 MBL fold metallo-hydrolase [bacterium M00.F.Ca.ET.146.
MSTEVADRLVLLGSKGGPALRPGGPWPSSSFLELGGRTIVVDCGLGATRGLVDAGISLKALDLIFITHLHSDHVLELGPLIHTAWTAGLATPVTVFGPPGTSHYWQRFCQAMDFDIEIRIADEGRPDIRALVLVEEFGEGSVLEEHGLVVTALRVDHPPVTDCFALRFEHGGRSVVFSADTAFFPPLAGFASGADILVHEAMLEEGVERLVARTGNGARLKEHLLASHSFAEEAGRIASDAGVRRLVLNHLIPADDPDIDEGDWVAAVRKSWAGDLTIARDGLVVGLSSKKAAGGEETA